MSRNDILQNIGQGTVACYFPLCRLINHDIQRTGILYIIAGPRSGDSFGETVLDDITDHHHA